MAGGENNGLGQEAGRTEGQGPVHGDVEGSLAKQLVDHVSAHGIACGFLLAPSDMVPPGEVWCYDGSASRTTIAKEVRSGKAAG